MAQEFTDQNIEEIIASGKPVIVDFWATWCSPCMAMGPIIEELAEQYKEEVIIGKYNCDEESSFATDYRIMGLPTLLFFKNGKPAPIRLSGSQSRAKIEEKIKELLAL
ncbi:MAG: thioredoxin [Muribaculaceae bacterium]|nr:thioredoxin [Muribaculaceae bacterium]